MNWKGCGSKRSWHNLRYYPGICLKGLGKTTKHLSQNSWRSGQDSNSVPPEYKSEALSLDHTSSVKEAEECTGCPRRKGQYSLRS
jgi:hypothetical protein